MSSEWLVRLCTMRRFIKVRLFDKFSSRSTRAISHKSCVASARIVHFAYCSNFAHKPARFSSSFTYSSLVKSFEVAKNHARPILTICRKTLFMFLCAPSFFFGIPHIQFMFRLWIFKMMYVTCVRDVVCVLRIQGINDIKCLAVQLSWHYRFILSY